MKLGSRQAKWFEPLVFELGSEGRRAYHPQPFSEDMEIDLPEKLQRKSLNLPELSEIDVVRHVVRLSQMNWGVDSGPYTLGSCTMKYNPKVNEAIARLPGFADLHPDQPEGTVQGILKALYLLEESLKQLTGFTGATLQPAAGAHGEFTGILMIRAYHLDHGNTEKNEIIIPDSAHGTNPASASMGGFKVIEIPSNEKGMIDLEALKAALSSKTAGAMITNPNTLGIFESEILEVSRMVHEVGGLMYWDGANLNGVMGVVKPAEMGFDVMHTNLHKTFSGPHGTGGPGAGVVLVNEVLEPYLPIPRIKYDTASQAYYFDYNYPKSIGHVHSYYGNVGILLRALAYIARNGGEGLRESCLTAVVNANYLGKKFKELEGFKFEQDPNLPRKHEVVVSATPLLEKTTVSAFDVAKRLLDYRIHAPTVYFPLIVKEAMMIEPTEAESKTSLLEIYEAYKAIQQEAMTKPEIVKEAPHTTSVGRLDETGLAKEPLLSWKMMQKQNE